jgi:hypothetical protein
MVAHALLAVITATEHTQRPAPAELIALTCNEIRRLFMIYVIEPGRTMACPDAWSQWRRRHQTPRPRQPLPAPRSRPRMDTTIYNWSTKDDKDMRWVD